MRWSTSASRPCAWSASGSRCGPRTGVPDARTRRPASSTRGRCAMTATRTGASPTATSCRCSVTSGSSSTAEHPPRRMAELILTARALNRALLARQMLLERSTGGITDVMEGMGGIQAQYAPAGYIGLWSRMRDFERPMLTRALEDRSAIQATLMRATIHMVSATDYWPMEIGVRRIRREWFENVSRRQIEQLDPARVADAV